MGLVLSLIFTKLTIWIWPANRICIGQRFNNDNINNDSNDYDDQRF